MSYLIASGGASVFPPVVSVYESPDGWDCLTYATRLQVILDSYGALDACRKASFIFDC